MLEKQVVELCYDDQNKSLIMDLRQHPADVNSPNDWKIETFASEFALKVSTDIQNILAKHKYLIIRNFSTDVSDAVTLARLLSDQLFYQGEELKYVHYFETQPFQTEIFSSSLACGAFHTDFWSRTDTPNYIMIQCIEPDPRHPYYSRNQVVLVETLIEYLELLHPRITSTLLQLSLPHKVKETLVWVKLLSLSENKLMIRLHPKYVVENMLSSEHYIDGIAIHKLISDVSQSIAADFALNSGDVLIVSNKFCLHRRGEATVKFGEALSRWNGRKVNTLRFF